MIPSLHLIPVFPEHRTVSTRHKVDTQHILVEETLMDELGFLFSFLCTLCLLESQFPDQGLNPGHGSETTES